MLARCHGRCVAAAARAARGRLWAPCWRTGWRAGGRALGTAAEGGGAAAEEGLSVAGRVLLFAPAVITLGLGSWQLDRLQWKYGQIELRAKLLSSAPERITSAQGLLGLWARLDPGQGGQEFAPFTLRGRFDHAQEVYVGLRGKPGAVDEGLGAGYSVVTPFVVEDGGEHSPAQTTVLVNRGWVPSDAQPQRAADRAARAARGAASRADVEELYVVVRRGEKGAWCAALPACDMPPRPAG